MTAEIEHQLPIVRAQLHQAIAQLIDPRPQHHDGKTCWLNPRYHELRDALASPGTGNSHGQPKSKPPAWLDALDTLAKIDHKVRKLEPDTLIAQCDDYPTVQRLRVYSLRKWRPQDVKTIKDATNDLQTYAKDIDKLFAQAPKYLPDACPYCGKSKVTRQLDGETVRVPALQITDAGGNCNNCGHHWPFIALPILGHQLGYRIEGVIE